MDKEQAKKRISAFTPTDANQPVLSHVDKQAGALVGKKVTAD